jgi:hypothetical protein
MTPRIGSTPRMTPRYVPSLILFFGLLTLVGALCVSCVSCVLLCYTPYDTSHRQHTVNDTMASHLLFIFHLELCNFLCATVSPQPAFIPSLFLSAILCACCVLFFFYFIVHLLISAIIS